jgi:hypothetical protein
MTGYYQMARGWMENDFFDREPFTEREAWQWLVEQAAWRPSRTKIKGTIVPLERGQLSFSVRFMADKWQWSKSRVDRFLKRLAAENMVNISSKNRDNSGTTAGHPAGQGQSIITVCNYEKYQSPKNGNRDNEETLDAQKSGQQRDKEEEVKKEEERKEEGGGAGAPSGGYEFSGSTIRLRGNDLARWKSAYHAIPDIAAELTALDAWFEKQPEAKQKGWFHIASGALNRKHQELLAAKVRENEGPTVPL